MGDRIRKISVLYQWWLAQLPGLTPLPNGAQLALTLIAGVAAIFSYAQWLDARREASLDKFYDRLNLVNNRYYEWEEARLLTKHFWWEEPPSQMAAAKADAEFEKCMYVYLEFDNLEYMVSRYQLGFVTKSLLRRAIWTFLARCEVGEFSAIAKRLALRGEGGYNASTGRIVLSLVGAVSELGRRT